MSAVFLLIQEYLLTEFQSYYWFPLLLGFGLTLAYIFLNQWHNQGYQDVIYPRRLVWTVFSAVVFFSMWFAAGLGVDVSSRVTATQPILWQLSRTAEDLRTDVENLKQSTYDILRIPNLKISAPLSETLAGHVAEIATDSQELSRTLAHDLPLATSVEVTGSISNTAQNSTDAAYLALLYRDLSAVAYVSAKIPGQLQDLQKLVEPTPTPKPPDNGKPDLVAEVRERQDKDYRLSNKLQDIVDSASIVHITLTSLVNTASVPYITMGLLYCLFLILPWLIFAVYIVSRRARVTHLTKLDLNRFGLLQKFMRPDQLADDADVFTAKVWAGKLVPDTRLEDDLATIKDIMDMDNDGSARRVFSYRTYGHFARIVHRKESAWGEEEIVELDRIKRAANEEATEFVIGRKQFYSRDYLLPLCLLTAVSAVGWYYIFLSGTLTNLYKFVVQGGSAAGINALLTANMAPFTVAFLGGWIFVIIMLLNNWTRDDLYPRTFFYAAVHLMIALMIGFAFSVAGNLESSPLVVFSVNAIAFAASIAPYDSIGLFLQRWFESLRKVLPDNRQNVQRTDAWVDHEIRDLPGLSNWDEVRLHQEGISSMTGLATANLERLVLQTQYSGATLANWVDQALLRVHADKATMDKLFAANIRTATDLLWSCASVGDQLQPKDLVLADPERRGPIVGVCYDGSVQPYHEGWPSEC